MIEGSKDYRRVLYYLLVSFNHIGDYHQALKIQHLLSLQLPSEQIRIFDVESNQDLPFNLT